MRVSGFLGPVDRRTAMTRQLVPCTDAWSLVDDSVKTMKVQMTIRNDEDLVHGVSVYRVRNTDVSCAGLAETQRFIVQRRVTLTGSSDSNAVGRDARGKSRNTISPLIFFFVQRQSAAGRVKSTK